MSEKYNLPESWETVLLIDVLELNPAKLVISTDDESHFVFVPMSAVSAEFGGIDVSGKRPYREVKKGYTQFQAADVLFAKITPCMENGKIAVVPELDSQVGYGSTEFHVLRSLMHVDPKWIAYYLSQSSVRRDAKRNMTGSAGQLRVPKRWLEKLRIPIAPLKEQKRIVEKIEELFSELDAGVAALERAKTKLKRYRASVLKAAVHGSLTADWRSKHPEVEPASQLLERILAERRRKWEEEQLAKFETAGKKPPKDWRERYKEPFTPDPSELPELPKSWCWASVDQMGEVQLGRQRSPQKRSKDYPTKYIRAANITEEGIDTSNILEMEFTPSEVDRFRMKKGDLVVSEASGSSNQVGKPAIWNNELPVCCFQNTVIRLRPEGVRSDYLLVILKHCYSNKVFAKIAGGVGINHLGATKFSRIPIPLAPASEQVEIANEVERQLSILKKSEEMIEANLVRASRNRQSILQRAFEGKLAPQDPNDEPANILLERIRSEQARTHATISKPRRKGTRKMKERLPISGVIEKHPKGATPEVVFAEAGLNGEELNDVDQFYSELDQLVSKRSVEVIRPDSKSVIIKPRTK
ncbi:Type-1 restriction enzyme EcoKI specificity protein [Bremerella volcania]|uniref:Type-1 restriction enzyme EcoKI specificity protein n=1 Tax=Bremerella volcania TaxID=2527984 RepID=A0A518C4C0_9BACT|nr:restriction endonuclease subunit S [Bremerella volcania]QDU74065.1 Type-1 restriction enzyme EcoKI specificity protein [Bremerella volcania]